MPHSHKHYKSKSHHQNSAKGHISKFVENLRCNILAERTDSIEDFEVTAKIDTVSYYERIWNTRIYLLNNSVTHNLESEMSALIPKLNNRNIEEAMGYVARMSKHKVQTQIHFQTYILP